MRSQNHKTFRFHAIAVALAISVTAAGTARAADDKPRVAIVDFEASPGGWTLPPPQIGETVAQLMLDQLVTSGEFHILDGEWLQYGAPRGDRRDARDDVENAIERRLDVVRSNAKAAGVDYLIIGSVTKFSNEKKQRTIGGAALRVPVAGGLRRTNNDLAVSLLVRIVDVNTGEVIATTTGNGVGRRKNIGVGGLGLFRGPIGALVSHASAGSRDAQLDEALQRAVAAASSGIVKAAQRLSGRTEGM
jgi:curli biogenesis system outer membrane secretion channel CsgG